MRKGLRRGFVIGELLVTVVLLAVAVSSLAALMYSVTRPPRAKVAAECTGKAASSPKCARTSAKAVTSGSKAEPVTVRTRTDSASQSLVKKQRISRPVERPDRGFIR